MQDLVSKSLVKGKNNEAETCYHSCVHIVLSRLLHLICWRDNAATDRYAGSCCDTPAHLYSRRYLADTHCHTGSQYNPYPAPETRRLAAIAIRAGAAAFFGHHPHVPQGCERIGDGLAVYSLGDFVAPPDNEQTRRTFFARLTIADSRVLEYQQVPCFITDLCQTTLAAGVLHDEIAAHLAALSRTVADGSSDDLHFALARQRFFSQYVTSWIRELREGGPRVILRKIRNLRGYHAELIWKSIFGRRRPRRTP